MSSQDWSSKRVWVIGASSGIGAALSRELRQRGAQVVISARRQDRLEEVSQGTMQCVPFDVTDPDLEQVWDDVSAEGLPDVVVYCAGYWKQAEVGTFDPQEFDRHIDVHLGGLGRVLGAVVPDMVKRGQGQVAVVSSPAGYRGLPGGEYYGSVKAAQINLVEALGGSLARKGVVVTQVCPGFVRTEMTAGNTFKMPMLMEPEEAATRIADQLGTPRAEIAFPLPVILTLKAIRFLPAGVWRQISSRVRTADGG